MSTVETKPIAWSYSSLQKFKNCPKRFYEEKVARSVKPAPTEQTLWGEQVHAGMENALAKGVPLTGALAPYAPVAQRLGNIKGRFSAEKQLAINNALKPVEWFARDVWCRGILDAVWIDGEVGKIIDYKTGRRRGGSDQLKLFALLLFAHELQVERVNVSFVWLQTGKMDVEKYKRSDVPILWQDFLADVRRLETAHRNSSWVPRPSGLCSYCPVQTCSFWKSTDGSKR